MIYGDFHLHSVVFMLMKTQFLRRERRAFDAQMSNATAKHAGDSISFELLYLSTSHRETRCLTTRETSAYICMDVELLSPCMPSYAQVIQTTLCKSCSTTIYQTNNSSTMTTSQKYNFLYDVQLLIYTF